MSARSSSKKGFSLKHLRKKKTTSDAHATHHAQQTPASDTSPANNRNRNKKKRQLAKQDPLVFVVRDLSHEGRGIAVYDDTTLTHCGEAQYDAVLQKQGKKVFINFALVGETVSAKLTDEKRAFDEADCITVMEDAASDRVTPFCEHFGVCGGCSLQHMSSSLQVTTKQRALENQLAREGLVAKRIFPPLTHNQRDYRRKTRMGVRYLAKEDRIFLGYRARASNRLIEVNNCPILMQDINKQLPAIEAMLNTLTHKRYITHVELVAGEGSAHQAQCAVVIRHTKPLTQTDEQVMAEFFHTRAWQVYLQSHKSALKQDAMPEFQAEYEAASEALATLRNMPTPQLRALTSDADTSAPSVCDEQGMPSQANTAPNRLSPLWYRLPTYDLTLGFAPQDFIQVNAQINQKMTQLACGLLKLSAGEQVLDLFSGLGNFSLALAKQVGESGHVVGVEGSTQMTARATHNAMENGLSNCAFYTHDLTRPPVNQPWANEAQGGYDAIVLDPPRSGAKACFSYLDRFAAKRIVYVSCDMSTLARDAAILSNMGYSITDAGVMDMFSHTGHVESMLCFERTKA